MCSFQSTLGFKDPPASSPPPPLPASLTLLSRGSLVEDLDGPADVQVEQSHGGRSLPLTLLLQRSQEDLHVDVGAPADPAAEPQGEAALLAVVPRDVRLPVWAAPAPAALCCAWRTNTEYSMSQFYQETQILIVFTNIILIKVWLTFYHIQSLCCWLTWAGLHNVLDTRVDHWLFVPLQLQLHVLYTLLHMWYSYRKCNWCCSWNNSRKQSRSRCTTPQLQQNFNTLVKYKLDQSGIKVKTAAESKKSIRHFYYLPLKQKLVLTIRAGYR